ncbi:MAG: branched-chain amino acid ABC transporter permease [Dehalococcoidia bacterium]|nr:branched-chain amino acid ABC transporter permease [Dehalococcoidia bacterium]
MAEFLQFTITGITLGMVYALVALGIVMIFKSSGVLNLAQGELVLIFSWFAFGMLAQVELPYWLGLVLVIVFAGGLGWIIERFCLRRLIAQPILSLIGVTLGLIFVLRGIVNLIWPRNVASLPRLFGIEPIHVGPAVVSQEYIWVLVICLLLFGLLTLYFKYHKMGIAMRATADDQFAVQACGIPVTKIFSTSWMLACVTAAIGGFLISSIGGVTFGLAEMGTRAFSVVILGGLDSFIGCIVAGPIIGLCENIGGGYLNRLILGGVKDIIPFIVLIVVLCIKPYGLFGEVRIERI